MLELFRVLASSSSGDGDASEVEGSNASIKFLRVPPLDTAWPRGSEHRLGVGGSSGKAVTEAAGGSSDGVPRGASDFLVQGPLAPRNYLSKKSIYV